jgi:hypothetical protein
VPGSDTAGEAFAAQVAVALAFLGDNHSECLRLASFPEVECRILDFAVPFTEEQLMRSNRIPFELVSRAAAFRMALEVTVYTVSEERR